MSIQANRLKTNIRHQCDRCGSKMVLPEWVALEEEYDSAVFQCPQCNREAEIDISDYPKTRVRVVVDGWENAEEGERHA